MMNTDRRTKMRASLAGSGCAVMATVFDPVSARIAEELAYEAALVGGSIISHAVLGAPDVIVLTLTELAEQVHRCARVSTVPLLIDADHGYGNALSVMRTIQELDAAGAAAVMIEDTLLPRAVRTVRRGATIVVRRIGREDQGRGGGAGRLGPRGAGTHERPCNHRHRGCDRALLRL